MNLEKLERRTYKLQKMYCRYYDGCDGCPFETTPYKCKLEEELKAIKRNTKGDTYES